MAKIAEAAAAAAAVCAAVSGAAAGAVAPAVGGLVRADLKARCDFPADTFTPPFIPMLTGRKATGYEPHLWDAPKNNGTVESGLYNATKLFLTGEKLPGEAEMQSILWRDPACENVPDVGVYSSVLCHLTSPAKAVVNNYLNRCSGDAARLLGEILKPGGLSRVLARTNLPRGFNSLGRKMEQVRDYLAQNERTLPPLQMFKYVAKVLDYHLNIGAAPQAFYTAYLEKFSDAFRSDFKTWVKHTNPALYDKVQNLIAF